MITGKDDGKTGKVLRVVRSQNKVIVEGVNLVCLLRLVGLASHVAVDEETCKACRRPKRWYCIEGRPYSLFKCCSARSCL
mgnify:CR=1 FL=1